MSYQPPFTISPVLLNHVERIAAVRERIVSATIEVPWMPALQLDSRARSAHSSTAIEGNPLTLEEVRALEQGRDVAPATDRARREVLNYFAGLRFIERNTGLTPVDHDAILRLHRIIATGVMDQGASGRYRSIRVRVGPYVPPNPEDVSGLMRELLAWWNGPAGDLSPILSSAILHYRFEAIHPFADGNGRMGRALALWELYRRGFDTNHIFSVDEFYWEDRPRYYERLQAVRHEGDDLTRWLEYTAEGLLVTLERVWTRLQHLAVQFRHKKIFLRPRQERLLQLLAEHKSMTPRAIWDALGVSKQGALDLLRPLVEAGLVQRTGTRKSGHYALV